MTPRRNLATRVAIGACGTAAFASVGSALSAVPAYAGAQYFDGSYWLDCTHAGSQYSGLVYAWAPYVGYSNSSEIWAQSSGGCDTGNPPNNIINNVTTTLQKSTNRGSSWSNAATSTDVGGGIVSAGRTTSGCTYWRTAVVDKFDGKTLGLVGPTFTDHC